MSKTKTWIYLRGGSVLRTTNEIKEIRMRLSNQVKFIRIDKPHAQLTDDGVVHSTKEVLVMKSAISYIEPN